MFKKIKDEEKLEDDDLQVLTCFIDEFSNVSTHEATVGEKIASQVLEVNIHHHTSTCYKKGTSCRFGYLRRPSSLEEISFAQFAKMYRSMSAKKRGIQADDDEEEVDSCDEELQTVEKVATSGKFDAKYFLCCNYTVHLLLKCCKCAAIQLHYFINVLK